MSKKKKPIKTNAVRLLEQKKIDFTVDEYCWTENHVGAKDTAKELGISADHIFKTLVAVGNKTGPIVAVVPGNKELDLKKLAKISGNKKVDMLPLKELEPLTGYVHGGCSPVGMKKLLPTYFALEAQNLKTMHCSAGARGLQLSVAPIDLAAIVEASFADISLEG